LPGIGDGLVIPSPGRARRRVSDAECDELCSSSPVSQNFGCGVLLIEHNMRVVMGACKRIHVIDGGKTIAEGTPVEIQQHTEVIRAYLGSKSEQPRARRH
jgi:branched-chain amino acid transport system ATP-binding protein